MKSEYEKVEPRSIKYWVQAIDEDFKRIKNKQDKGELPIFGAYLIEWDFGEHSNYEYYFWAALFDYENEKDANTEFYSYVYLNSENSFSEPAIDNSSMFEKVVQGISSKINFKQINKRLPFYFIFQEHDASHIHTVKIVE